MSEFNNNLRLYTRLPLLPRKTLSRFTITTKGVDSFQTRSWGPSEGRERGRQITDFVSKCIQLYKYKQGSEKTSLDPYLFGVLPREGVIFDF